MEEESGSENEETTNEPIEDAEASKTNTTSDLAAPLETNPDAAASSGETNPEAPTSTDTPDPAARTETAGTDNSGSTVGFEVRSSEDGDKGDTANNEPRKKTSPEAPHNSDETSTPPNPSVTGEGGETEVDEVASRKGSVLEGTSPEGTTEEEPYEGSMAIQDGSSEGQEAEQDDDIGYLQPPGEIGEELTAQELDAEEAQFRAKYALDLEDEDEEEEATALAKYNEIAGEEASPKASAVQMDAIIKYLEEEEGEGVDEEEPKQSISRLNSLNLKSQYDEEEEGEEREEAIQMEESGWSNNDNDGNEPSVMVLGPDHPKMQRFQRALTEHLQRQIYLADCEMRNLENDLKMRKKERTEMGTNLYNLQHEILRQSELMEKYEKDIGKVHEKREKVEIKTKEMKKHLGDLKAECLKEEEQELSLRESLKTLDFTEHVVREAAEKYDGELKTRQLVDEKLSKMKVKSESEKRDQDFYLDKVLTHVQHMELINAGIRRQIHAHQQEQTQLSTYINEAVTEIEALQIEKSHLQRAWNDTIQVVRSRDDALAAARDQLKKTKEELRIRESELRSIGRLISKEQETHEKSIILLRRRRMEERILNNQLRKLEEQNEALKDQLSHLNKIKKAVDQDLLKANSVFLRKQKEIHGPRRQLEQLAIEKLRLEDQILHVLHEQSGLNKAASHIQVLIKDAREKTRNMENEVARVENENSVLSIDVEKLRAELFKKTSTLDELEKRCGVQEKILQEQMRDILQSERVIQRKTSEVDKLNKKLEKLINQQGGVETAPLEREIIDVEKTIATEKDTVNRLQEEWLRRQDDLVRFTSQRDAVMNQNEVLRKEVFIMERKRQRLDSEVEKKKSEIAKVKKTTEQVRAEISAVNARLHEDKSNRDQMDKDNILIQNELMALLKDAELEAMELEQEIEMLEQERLVLLENLHSAHEQNLQWEKKVHLAKELKNNLRKEQEGSTSSLKLEIHHMQVRYNELIRAQEKLMSDLERSIDRRDRIIEQADMNLQRDNVNPKNTKLNIQRNFASIKERNRLLVRESAEIEQQVRNTMGSIHELEEKLNEASNQLNKVRETIQAYEAKIAESSIQKHKNLVEVVIRQEKFRILESMKFNRYKPSGKNIEEIGKMLEESEKNCYSLVKLSDEISKDHPEAAVHVKLVKASILPGV